MQSVMMMTIFMTVKSWMKVSEAPYRKYLIRSLRIVRGFHQRLFWKSKRQNAQVTNFHVTVVGTGRVPQIEDSPRVSSIFERKFGDEHQIKLPKCWTET